MKSLLLPIQHLLCITLLLGWSCKLYAQQAGLKLYTVNEGLPSTQISRVFQDNFGYLWVATSAGLSRFDGLHFQNYGLTDGLSSLYITKVFQDSRGRLWVGTLSGMVQYRNNRFIYFPSNDSLSSTWVFDFVETKDKRLWALTAKGVYEFNDSNWKKITLYPGFENTACRNIVEKNEELYINYPDNIVCRDKKGNWVQLASNNDPGSIFNSLSLQGNDIWVATHNNIYTIHNYQLIPLLAKELTTPTYFDYLVDSKNRLWISGWGVVKISEPGDWQHFTVYEEKQNAFYSVTKDVDDNLWICSEDGLHKVKDIPCTIISNNKLLPLEGIYNIIPLADNRVLFCSGLKAGIQSYENNNFKQIMPPVSGKNKNYYRDPVDAYAYDDSNTLWMLTRFKKLLRFKGEILQDFSNALPGKSAELPYDIVYAKKRKQFFVCADSTLLYGDSSKLLPFIPANTGSQVLRPARLHSFNNGLLLVYLYDKGVYSIDSLNNLNPFFEKAGMGANKNSLIPQVCFYEDAHNNFWIGTPGFGLYQYGFTTGEKLIQKAHYTIEDGLQSNNIISLTCDRQNRLWVATNKGLDILHQTNLEKWEVFNFAKPEDLTLKTSEFEKLITDAKGDIWFSTPSKIIKFNTADIKLHKKAPRINIEKVSLSFKETDWSSIADSLYTYYQLPYKPVLEYNQNSLALSFNAIDFSVTNSNIEYSYRLSPLDTSWSIPSAAKSVSFAQLPPGEYQFMVKAKNMASDWSPPALFSFAITPPFWDMWWFRLIVILVVAFIITFIFRSRLRKIKHDAFIERQLKELEMKALRAQMNPHFIYNALNSIQSLVANDKKNEGIHYIGSFSRLLRQVLDNSESKMITLDKELETIGLYIQIESLRLDMQLQYEKHVPENIVPEFEKIPPLILQPFIENALWHGLSHKAGEKVVSITVSVNGEWLVCDITDNGIGRAKAQELKRHATLFHESKAIDITRRRLIDFNEDELVSPIAFFDLYDNQNNPSGTRVSVHIKRKSA